MCLRVQFYEEYKEYEEYDSDSDSDLCCSPQKSCQGWQSPSYQGWQSPSQQGCQSPIYQGCQTQIYRTCQPQRCYEQCPVVLYNPCRPDCSPIKKKCKPIKKQNTYQIINLVSNQPNLAPNTDTNLVNPWATLLLVRSCG